MSTEDNLPSFGKDKFDFNDFEKKFKANPNAEHMRENSCLVKAVDFTAPTDLPQMFEKVGLKFQDGDNERVLEMVASDGSVDLAGDIINPKGWDLGVINKNPQFLWMHNPFGDPIGALVKTWVEDKVDKSEKFEHLNSNLKVLPFFARTKLGDEKLVLYKSGILRAGSVGFRVSEIRELTRTQKKDLGMGRWGIFCEKQSLHEFSGVTLPCNTNAIVTAKSRANLSANLDDILQRIALQLEELKTVKDIHRRFDELESVIREISEQGQPMSVRSKDLYDNGGKLSFADLESLVADVKQLS